MAVFGPISSANPNILFDAAKVDRDALATQRNRLMVQGAQQDMQAQTYERDANARMAMARSLVGLPEDQAAAQWGAERQRLQAAGFGHDLPEQFPGMARIKAVADSDLTTFQRYQLEEKRRQSEGLASLFGAPASGQTAGAINVSMPSAAGAAPGGGYADRMIGLESGGDPTAKNPRSSAFGAGQFLDKTWLSVAPNITDTTGMTPQQILDLRKDPALSRKAVDYYGRENGALLANAGLPDTDATRALAHRYGPLGAMRLLKSDRGAPIDQVVGSDVLAANPDLRGKTVGDAIGFYEARMDGSGAGGSVSRPGGGGGAAILEGLTPDQQQRLMSYARVPGTTPQEVIRQAETWRQHNQTDARQQEQDARQRMMDERRFRLDADKAARDAPAGPIRGNGLNNSLMNILLTGDPASPEYAAAFARLGAEEVNPATGAVRRPDMSPFRTPTYAPPGAVSAPPGPGPVTSGSPVAAAAGASAPPITSADVSAGGPRNTSATAAATATLPPTQGPFGPVNALSPQAPGGRNYGQADYRPSTQASPQAREAVRKAEVEVGRITSAIDRFEQVFAAQGGGSINAVLNNPASPEAQQLLGAYEAMKATLRSEAFLNTGVLQPAEAKMLDDMLLSPQSFRGLMATPAAMKARLGEFRQLINRGLVQQRASAGIAPEVSVPGPGGQGDASPPQAGSRPPLSSFRR